MHFFFWYLHNLFDLIYGLENIKNIIHTENVCCHIKSKTAGADEEHENTEADVLGDEGQSKTRCQKQPDATVQSFVTPYSDIKYG